MQLHPAGQPTHWLPCGKCLGCRELQQQQLAIRTINEARYHSPNIFLTLTYDEQHQTQPGLDKRDLKNFWKRIRKMQDMRKIRLPRNGAILPVHAPHFKYLACGEYGERTRRRHCHAAVLGMAVNDQARWDADNNRSTTLEQAWGQGIVTISELTEDRIKYVAGYVLKKAGYRKQTYCDEHGEQLQAPYRDMSKGLGKKWLNKYQNDLRNGYLQHDNAKYPIPRYYQDIIKKTNPQLHEYIQQQKANNWKEITTHEIQQLHNAEIIRQKQIRDQKQRPL